jgi:hypothetical protein
MENLAYEYQQHARVALNVPGLIQPLQGSNKQAAQVLNTVIAMKGSNNNGKKISLDRIG